MGIPRCGPKHQQGTSTAEFLVVALALVLAWQGIEGFMRLFAEHQTEYNYSISQPF